MKINQIAVQLYTLRDFIQTPDDFASTLQRVHEIGFSALEFACVEALSATEVAKAVRNAGMEICSSHEPGRMILNEPQRVVDRLGELGVTHAVYAFPGGVDMSNPGHVERLIGGLEASGAVFCRAGMTLCYHNHALEFFQRDGRTVLDEIYDCTAPPHLHAELDIHWVQAGGGDPVEACRRLAGRLPLLHVKDFSVSATGERLFSEVGYGNLNIPKILAATEAAGCGWFIVEQDSCPSDPFDCIARSFHYLKSLCE